MNEEEVKRELGLLELTLLGVGVTVGAGVMVFLPLAYSLVGQFALLLNIACLAFMLLFAWGLGELASIFPYAGSPYYASRYSLWPRISTFLTWMLMWTGLALLMLCGLGGEALSFSYYLKELIPAIAFIPSPILGSILVLGILGINIVGVSKVGKSQIFLLVFMLGGFLIWGLSTASHVSPELYSISFLPEGLTLPTGLAAFGLVYYAYVGGIITIAGMTGEAKYPATNVPRAMIISLFFIFLVNGWVLGILPGLATLEQIGAAEAPLAAATSFAHAGRIAFFSIVLCAVVGIHPPTLNAGLAAGSRHLYSMARDKMLPSWISKVHSRFKTPTRALIIFGVALIAIILPNLIEILGAAGAFSAAFQITVLMLAVLSLKRRLPDLKRPFEAPTWAPTLAIAISIFIMMGLGWFISLELAKALGTTWLMGLLAMLLLTGVLVGVGLSIYFLYVRKALGKPQSISKLRQEILTIDTSKRAESKWTERHAPIEAKGESKKELDKNFNIFLAVCLIGFAAFVALTVYLLVV